MQEQIKIPKHYLDLLDQVYEIERKLDAIPAAHSINRNIHKIKDIFQQIFSTPSELDIGLTYHNPLGETYNETRTDLEASIAGGSADNLVVSEVIKPIIRYRSGPISLIARKGVVVVKSKDQTI